MSGPGTGPIGVFHGPQTRSLAPNTARRTASGMRDSGEHASTAVPDVG